MVPVHELRERVTLAFGGLTIRVSRSEASAGAREGDSDSLASFSVVSEPHRLGPLAGLREATQSSEGATVAPEEANPVPRLGDCEAWELAILAAATPSALEALDLSRVQHLTRRLRAAAGEWSPTARLARALRLGVAARHQFEGRSQPAIYCQTGHSTPQ